MVLVVVVEPGPVPFDPVPFDPALLDPEPAAVPLVPPGTRPAPDGAIVLGTVPGTEEGGEDDVAAGPVRTPFWAGPNPSIAASMVGSPPSMPRAQIPSPPMWCASA